MTQVASYTSMVPSSHRFEERWAKDKAPEFDDYAIGLERYQKFLWLAAKRKRGIVPTKEIDHMWHTHMLDPISYYQDCMKWFGYILGHNATIEAGDLLKFQSDTQQLWREEYHEEYPLKQGSGCVNCGQECRGE